MQIKISYKEKSVVAFLDVLGFKALLGDTKKVERYFGAVIESLHELEKKDLRAILISDSVVLKIPFRSEDSVRDMCVAVARIQANLAIKDIWLRGGITIGEVEFQTHGELQIAVGGALARAYDLEAKYAKHPRVLIDPRLVDELGGNRVQLLRRLHDENSILPKPIFDAISPDDGKAFIPGGTVTADGLWIDYAFLILNDETKLRAVVNNLRKRLYEGQEHYEKYRWVQSYLWSSFAEHLYSDKYGKKYEELDALISNL